MDGFLVNQEIGNSNLNLAIYHTLDGGNLPSQEPYNSQDTGSVNCEA